MIVIIGHLSEDVKIFFGASFLPPECVTGFDGVNRCRRSTRARADRRLALMPGCRCSSSASSFLSCTRFISGSPQDGQEQHVTGNQARDAYRMISFSGTYTRGRITTFLPSSAASRGAMAFIVPL